MTQDSAFRQAYDKWHDSFSVDSEVDTPWHRAVQSYLPAIGKLDGKRILEIGCGRGAFACWLSRAYSSARVTTADFSGAAIAQASSFAQKSSINNIEWKIENIQVTSLPGNSFDVVISCETVEHLLQPASAVKELARCSSPAVRYFLRHQTTLTYSASTAVTVDSLAGASAKSGNPSIGSQVCRALFDGASKPA